MYNIKVYQQLDSTNKYIKDNISILNDRDVIFALSQTSGRGRENRSFLSSDDSLTFSILFKDKNIVKIFKDISLMAGASVYLTLSKYLNNVSIKWPNDVMVNDAKICGILLEGISYNELEDVIVGIGVNINNDKDFIKSVTNKKITSMYNEASIKFDIENILKEILDNFDKLLLSNKTYLDIVRNNNYLLNKKVLYDDKKVEVIGISDDNKLIVKDDTLNVYYLEVGEVII